MLQERRDPTRLPRGHPDEFLGTALTPAQQVRILLYRKRCAGITNWERLWPWTVARVRWPQDRTERRDWKRTIAWAEPAFHAAFRRELLEIDMSALVIFELPTYFDEDDLTA